MPQTQTITVSPYIFFYGRCEEALRFYESVFGGTSNFQRTSDFPAAEGCELAPGWADKVMHGTFDGPGFTLNVSDGQKPREIDPDAGNISLSVTLGDAQQADAIVAKLADGGKIVSPLQEVFWGGRFAVVHDRFGVEWFLSSP